MFVPSYLRTPEPPKKTLRCKLFGCRQEFVRGERIEGFLGEALAMIYYCKWCKTETGTVTEEFRFKCEVKLND